MNSRTRSAVLVFGGIAFLGSVLAACGSTTAAPAAPTTVTAEAAPAPTVTVTAEPETVEKEVEIPFVPQVCLDALDTAAELSDAWAGSSEVIVSYVEIIQSLNNQGFATDADVDKMRETVALNEEINIEVENLVWKFVEQDQECRAAAEGIQS